MSVISSTISIAPGIQPGRSTTTHLLARGCHQLLGAECSQGAGIAVVHDGNEQAGAADGSEGAGEEQEDGGHARIRPEKIPPKEIG